MKSLTIIITSVTLSVCILFLLSFSTTGFNDSAFSIDCYEYNNIVNDNLEKGSNDFILQSQFTKPKSWKKCEDKLPLCQPERFINRICMDSKQLSSEVSLQDVLQALYTYINEEQIPNHGLPLVLTVKKKPVTVTVYLRHKHEY